MKYSYQQVLCIAPETGINSNFIRRLEDGALIPNDLANTDWQTYQEWLSQGNTPLPPNE